MMIHIGSAYMCGMMCCYLVLVCVGYCSVTWKCILEVICIHIFWKTYVLGLHHSRVGMSIWCLPIIFPKSLLLSGVHALLQHYQHQKGFYHQYELYWYVDM